MKNMPGDWVLQFYGSHESLVILACAISFLVQCSPSQAIIKIMQRYIPETEESSLTNLSHGDSPKLNNFTALRSLKKADFELDLMKRRLSALRIKEEKNTRKSQTALKKVKYHQLVQEMEQRERERREIHRAENQLRMQRQKNINSSERSTRKEKITHARQVYKEDKNHLYKAEKEISKSLAERLKVLNESEYFSKRETNFKIKDYQEKSKQSYRLYMLQRQSAIRFHKESETSRLEEMQEKRELEMRNLARLELQMLERQSKSREAAEDSVRQLKQVMSPLSRSKVSPYSNNPEELKI